MHGKFEKWEASAEMHERRLLSKLEGYFISVENSSSNQGVLGENLSKHIPQKKSFRSKRNRNSAQEIEIMNLVELKVASSPKKRGRTERSTMTGKVARRS